MSMVGTCVHPEHPVDGVVVQQLVIQFDGVDTSSGVDHRHLPEAPMARAARARSRSACSMGALQAPARHTSAMERGKVGVFRGTFI